MVKQEFGRKMSDFTSFKIGGPVFCWAEAEDMDGVLEAVAIAEAFGKPLAVIGKGSNILAQEKGFDGVLVNLGKGFDYIEVGDSDIVKAGAGLSIFSLVRECAGLGLAGCEFLAGIPGSLGGAIFMNAGVRDEKDNRRLKEIKDIVVDVDTLDLKDKKRKSLNRDEIDFSYRSSGLDGKCILGASIKLKKDEKSSIDGRIYSFMKKRAWMGRLGFPTAGSVFKNPDDARPAGRLIEECGLKGRRSGSAEISSVHANFIVNTGGATSKDVLELVELARKNVRDRFSIDLELELKII